MVSETTSLAGGEGSFCKNAIYGHIWAGNGRSVKSHVLCGRGQEFRAKFPKLRPMKMDQDNLFQPAGHIWIYVGFGKGGASEPLRSVHGAREGFQMPCLIHPCWALLFSYLVYDHVWRISSPPRV